MRPANDSKSQVKASSLVELMASMTILSVLLIVLGTTLDVSLSRFRTGVDRTESQSGIQSAAGMIKGDLQSSLIERPAQISALPDDVTPEQRRFFSDRVFFPIEINRFHGDGSPFPHPVSLPNAAPQFDSLVCVSMLPLPAYLETNQGDDPETAPGIVGYYVAYTRDSPLAGDSAASMKLFRHHRPGGDNLSSGRAGGILAHISHTVNDANEESGDVRDLTLGNPALIRIGQFENQFLPSLLGFRAGNLETFDSIELTAPWPALPISDYLISPPPSFSPDRGNAVSWSNPQDDIHDTVFPDEPVCENIVRFELRPLRRVEFDSGVVEWMGAPELNKFLSLSGESEWPCLVRPDIIEVTISTVDSTIATRLTSYEDWIIDWTKPAPSGSASLESLVRNNVRTRTFRIPLSATP